MRSNAIIFRVFLRRRLRIGTGFNPIISHHLSQSGPQQNLANGSRSILSKTQHFTGTTLPQLQRPSICVLGRSNGRCLIIWAGESPRLEQKKTSLSACWTS